MLRADSSNSPANNPPTDPGRESRSTAQKSLEKCESQNYLGREFSDIDGRRLSRNGVRICLNWTALGGDFMSRKSVEVPLSTTGVIYKNPRYWTERMIDEVCLYFGNVAHVPK